jgi:hypothetical protein
LVVGQKLGRLELVVVDSPCEVSGMIVDEIVDGACAVKLSTTAKPAFPLRVGRGEVDKGAKVTVDAGRVVKIMNSSSI